MPGTAVPDYPQGLTFEQVWATIQANSEQFRLDHEKLVEEMKEVAERQKETARQFEKTKRLIERNGRQIGGLHRRFGELAEHLVTPGIIRRFNELGYIFKRSAEGNVKIYDEQGRVKTEVDILLENDDCIIAVEVKTKPAVRDIEYHIRRLEILREDKDKQRDRRKIFVAMAGAIFEDAEKRAVLEAGMYVLEQSGDTMKINIPDGFVPREW